MSDQFASFRRQIGETMVGFSGNFECPQGYLIPVTTMMGVLGFNEERDLRRGRADFGAGQRTFHHERDSSKIIVVSTTDNSNNDFSGELVLVVGDHARAKKALAEFGQQGGVLHNVVSEDGFSLVQLVIACFSIKFIEKG